MTKQSHGLSNGYGVASSAFGVLAMTNGPFFKALDVGILTDGRILDYDFSLANHWAFC